MSKKLTLHNLFKSKEFIKNAKLANELTKMTGIEHGFNFCKPKNEVIVDKICAGTDCSISIQPILCDVHSHSFHTHPSAGKSKTGVADTYQNISKAFYSKNTSINCVKNIHDTHILCESYEPPTVSEFKEAQRKFNKFEQNKTYDNQKDFFNFTSIISKYDNTYIKME